MIAVDSCRVWVHWPQFSFLMVWYMEVSHSLLDWTLMLLMWKVMGPDPVASRVTSSSPLIKALNASLLRDAGWPCCLRPSFSLPDFASDRSVYLISELLFLWGYPCPCVLQESGLATWIGNHMHPLVGVPPAVAVILITAFVATFTEFASNTATIIIFLPIIAELVMSSPGSLMLVLASATSPVELIFQTGGNS